MITETWKQYYCT